MVTSRTEEDFLDEFDQDIDAVENELESVYGDEHKVVLVNLKEYNPKIFKVDDR